MHVIALKFRVYHVLCGGMFVCKCLGGIRTQNVRVGSKMMNMAYLRRVGSIVALLRYRTGTVQYLITVLVHAVEIIFCDNKNCHVPELITNPENISWVPVNANSGRFWRMSVKYHTSKTASLGLILVL